MPEAQIIELLVNGGANAAFAGFLLWQFFYQQKRLDARDHRSEKREDALRKKYEDDQEQLRARYDAVIKMYVDNEAKIKDSIITEIGQINLMIGSMLSTNCAVSGIGTPTNAQQMLEYII